ncbi:uncharacterized protein KGF55_005810 [Candida pseudojiufengensis]|uniref:uncharacterized protein n=1 Tax=Candida pseudojiufengensis TaxID=497109 RepID=UPI0022256EE9|nr:uncharacterized protein KGF55_005810 [Candida pseudojiufengensis]KAI5958467.1 hypothetical protein KGF55_005810 [Candida pseudojiufengensis]
MKNSITNTVYPENAEHNKYFQSIIDEYTGLEINKIYIGSPTEDVTLKIDPSKSSTQNYKSILEEFMLPFVEFELDLSKFNENSNNISLFKYGGKPTIFHVDQNEPNREFIIETIHQYGGVCSISTSNKFINISSTKFNWIHPIHIFLCINEDKVLDTELSRNYALKLMFGLSNRTVINLKYWLSKEKIRNQSSLSEKDLTANKILMDECRVNYSVMFTTEFIESLRSKYNELSKYKSYTILSYMRVIREKLIKEPNLNKQSNESNISLPAMNGQEWDFFDHYILSKLISVYVIYKCNILKKSEQFVLEDTLWVSSVPFFCLNLCPNSRTLFPIYKTSVFLMRNYKATQLFSDAIEKAVDEIQMMAINRKFVEISRNEEESESVSFAEFIPSPLLTYQQLLDLAGVFVKSNCSEENILDLARKMGLKKEEIINLKNKFNKSKDEGSYIKCVDSTKFGLEHYVLGKLLEKELLDLGQNLNAIDKDFKVSAEFRKMSRSILNYSKSAMDTVLWRYSAQEFMNFIGEFEILAKDQRIISMKEFRMNEDQILSQEEFHIIKHRALMAIFDLHNISDNAALTELSESFGIGFNRLRGLCDTLKGDFLTKSTVYYDRSDEWFKYVIFETTNGSLFDKILAVFPRMASNKYNYSTYRAKPGKVKKLEKKKGRNTHKKGLGNINISNLVG